MPLIQFNPKLIICDYFDKIINLIDIHTEEQLEKYTDIDLIAKPFEYEFIELSKYHNTSSDNSRFFRFEKRNEEETNLKDQNEKLSNYDLYHHGKMEIKPGSVKVRDYLNSTRDELIAQVKEYEEQALKRYQEIKDNVLKEIQTIVGRDTQIDEFKKCLFANKHIGLLLIDKIVDSKSGKNDNDSPFKMYLVVLDFYIDRDGEKFLSNASYCIDGFLNFGQNQEIRIQNVSEIKSTLEVDKSQFRLHLLKQYILGLIKHQDYLRVVDIKESDLFIERLYQNVCRIFSLFDIRDVDEGDFFKNTKSLTLQSPVSNNRNREIDVVQKRPAFTIQSLSSFSNLQSLTLKKAALLDNSFRGLINLERLDLDQCHFENFKSESFRHLSNLEFLTISNSDSFLNINLDELKRLRCLKVSHLSNYTFLETLSLNKDLEGLVIENDSELFSYLRHPDVQVFEFELKNVDKFDGKCLNGLPNIRHLSVYNKQHKLATLSIDLNRLRSLESIYFENIRFPTLDFRFEKLSGLKSLDFALCDFPLNSEVFSGLDNLRSLRMTCMMMVRGFEITSSTFEHLANLTELDLSNNLMNSLDPEVFSYLSRLETLDLSGNDGLNIAQSLFEHLNELKNLTIYKNQVSSGVEEFIRKFSKLTFLNNPYLDLI